MCIRPSLTIYGTYMKPIFPYLIPPPPPLDKWKDLENKVKELQDQLLVLQKELSKLYDKTPTS